MVFRKKVILFFLVTSQPWKSKLYMLLHLYPQICFQTLFHEQIRFVAIYSIPIRNVQLCGYELNHVLGKCNLTAGYGPYQIESSLIASTIENIYLIFSNKWSTTQCHGYCTIIKKIQVLFFWERFPISRRYDNSFPYPIKDEKVPEHVDLSFIVCSDQ